MSQSSDKSQNPYLLIVTDDAAIGDRLKGVLGQDYSLETVTDNAAAQHVLQERRPALILAVVHLSRRNGIELLRMIHSDGGIRDTPVLLLLHPDDDRSVLAGLEAGAVDCLSLSMKDQELLARIQARLGASQQEQTLREEVTAVRKELERVLDVINDQFLLIDHDWRIRYANPKAAERAGCAALEGRLLWETFPAMREMPVASRLHQAMQTRQTQHFEHFQAQDNGWYEHRVYPCEQGLSLFSLDITERRQTEQALRDNAERLRVAIKGSPITLFSQDRALRYTWFFNPTLNLDHNSIIGQQTQDLLERPQEVEAIDALKRQVMDTGQGLRQEVRMHFRGVEHFYDMTIEPLRDEHGEMAGVTCAAFDITDRKGTEKALYEQQLRLQALMDQVPVGIFEFDAQGELVFLNRYWYEMTGMTPQASLGQGWFDVIHPEDWEKVHRCRRAALENKQPAFEQEFRYRLADGSVRWVYAKALVLRDEQGEVSGQLGTVVDLTEHYRTQEQLRLWERVLASTVNGVVVTDPHQPDNPVIWVNAAFERLTGYPAEEVIGHNCRFLQGQDRYQSARLDIRTALREQREWRAVLRNYRKDGSLFWNELYLAPVRDERGRLTHFVGVQNDITEQKHYEEQLRHRVNHDLLTDLPNRTLLQDRLEHALSHAQRQGHSVAVLFLDLDRFKMINDSLGHHAGDVLLQAVALRLKALVRAEDTVARLGGDEFVVLLEHMTDDGNPAVAVANKILEALQQPFALDEEDFFINASIGIALFPQDGEDASVLIKNANTAMHQAKDRERGSIQLYRAAMHEWAVEKLSLENDLRLAVQRGELRLHYQPQMSLRSGRLIGLEALLRWQHPRRGLVSPALFIPVAEESGLIVPIGQWVLETACGQLRAWQAAGVVAPCVSVNLSARQFMQRNLHQQVTRIFAATGLPPRCLELEVTESLLMQDVSGAVETLKTLKQLGVNLAVDDFGTGYSSLSYLKRFPLDRLKIDQSFMRDITTDPGDAAIVQAIIALAHSLRLKVIAEGVETEEQLAYLRAKDCDEMQGYLFSRPLPADECTRLLEGKPALPPILETAPENWGLPTLLLVDDDRALLAFISQVLEREGYHVYTAQDAQAGLEQLARRPVGVIIADQTMPGITGMEFLRRVRELYPETVRLLLCGPGNRPTLIEAINEGAIYKFLEKPVATDQLRDTLREAFRLHEGLAKTSEPR